MGSNASQIPDDPQETLAPDQPETLETRARRLAERTATTIRPGTVGDRAPRLLRRLKTQQILLHDAYLLFARLSESEETHSYSAEWLLDNYYIVQQAIRQINEDMPEKFYRQLPVWGNFPRIFNIALDLVQASGANLDTYEIENYIEAYQSVTPLTMGELWALPVMLRFSIIETLVQAAVHALDISTFDESSPAEMLTGPLGDDARIANSITSLRTLAIYDWKEFFEKSSLVERTLRADPLQVYTRMDFATRDNYRKVVENLALKTSLNELEVAQQAIRLAEQSQNGRAQPDSPPRQAHVGYYLVDRGSRQLESTLGYRADPLTRLGHWAREHATMSYLGAIGLISLVLIILPIIYALAHAASAAQIALVLLFWLIPAVSLAVNLVNWLVTQMASPAVLPKLDFDSNEQGGIPDEHRAMIVIPALLTSADDVDSLVQQIEMHALRNPDPNFAYALLTDFSDAPQQDMPEDEEILQRAIEGVQELRDRYATQQGPGSFFLMHRKRQWNESEDAWIGWERKRGKLVELNRLLTGELTVPRQGLMPKQTLANINDQTSFTTIIGDVNAVLPIRYVITLDADTILPPGEAARLVGTMAHPLNTPEFDPQTGHVIAGYTILQPRAETLPANQQRTRFTAFYSGDTHFDLYTHAVSDVYQDLYGEGSYVGKGIYDVRAFRRSVARQIPENALLSHDLLEGLLGRAGLASDIVLYEDFPPTYNTFIRRLHRWIRGDWQVLPWLVPGQKDKEGQPRRQLTTLGRWKIIDNLRRSLLAPALLLLLVAGWLVLPGSPLFWTMIALLISGSPVLINMVDRLIQWTDQGRPPTRLTSADHHTGLRWLFSILFLVYEASIALDAIRTSLYRMVISRRKLLEWTPSAQEARLFNGMQSPWLDMLVSPLISALLFLLLLLVRPSALPVALPFLVAWFIAPQLVTWLNSSEEAAPSQIAESQRDKLRSLARRTWFFFEQFVGPSDHWLPPDHFQESPKGVVAHRTSATNIGLGMLSTLAAYDFGYVVLEDMLLRLRNTLTAIDQLEKYRGHLLNWYDTRNLASLPPRYVSTVDSGNLVGALIALRQGLVEIPGQPVCRWQAWEGISDTLLVLGETVEQIGVSQPDKVSGLTSQINALCEEIQAAKDNQGCWARLLDEMIEKRWPEIELSIAGLLQGRNSMELNPVQMRSLRLWADRVRFSLTQAQQERQSLVPWVHAFSALPVAMQSPAEGSRLAETTQALQATFSPAITLEQVDDIAGRAVHQLADLRDALAQADLPDSYLAEATHWIDKLGLSLEEAVVNAGRVRRSIEEVIDCLDLLIRGMDFSFLYDPAHHVFHIGYNLDTERMDSNYYDLLASEARLASLVAIARNEVPQSHWLHLGRPLASLEGRPALLSWSGTMFEYLMPTLIVRESPNTLLYESSRNAVRWQIEYGKQKDIPWGISESGFYFFDANQNYQYRAFGVPGLGFKRGLSEDLVISPYSTLLALPFAPQEVLENMDRLSKMHLLTDYGFYEAVDFTAERLPLGWKYAIVKSFMAHHQGMILLQIANFMHGDCMIERFHASPVIQSIDLLLQEQLPLDIPIARLAEQEDGAPGAMPVNPQAFTSPWRVPVENSPPVAHTLSNGRYKLLISNRGGGYSQWEEYALTRWRADTTLDDWGEWLYLQDLETGQYWTLCSQHISPPESQRDALFSPSQVEFIATVNNLNSQVKVMVSTEDDVEIRQVRLSNPSERPRRLAIVSYAEVVLASLDADRRHQAFAKMMVESDFESTLGGLIFRRRPRGSNDAPVYLLHALVRAPAQDEAPAGNGFSYESNRLAFLGRNRSPRAPLAIETGGPLSGATGYVLDPIMALRQEIEIPPHSSLEMAFLTAAGGSRHDVVTAARRYLDWAQVERAFTQSRYTAEIELRRLELTSTSLERYQSLFSALVYPQPGLRAAPVTLAANRRGQPSLWAYAISGDYPILLVSISEREEMTLLRELLQAHAFWRGRGQMVDLVIFNEKEAGYAQEVHDRIFQLLTRTGNDAWLNRRGGIFLLRQSSMNEEDQALVQFVARATLDSGRPLTDQIQELQRQPVELPPFIPVESEPSGRTPLEPIARPEGLLFDNGRGGFTPDGREYVIYLPEQQPTNGRDAQAELPSPAPWINVIANPQGGFWVSEAGGGYTWAANSGENRLTPWSNDPVSDQPGDMLYLRDEETADVWSPTLLPAGENTAHLVRHGAGYTTIESHSYGLAQRLRLFVPREDPVKIIQLRLENRWQRVRRITVTYYADWVLGVNRDQMAPYILPEYDAEHYALLARNPYPVEFAERVAFLASSLEPHGLTTSRAEFLGRSGSYRRPAGLCRVGLSGQVTPGSDPCAALQVHIDLEPGESKEIYFLLGQGDNREHSLALVDQYRQPGRAQAAFEEVTGFWDELLSAIQVQTPEPSMDLILNRWLLYQDLSCRVWGRSALYQSSGAYGFRDQLQDIMALVHTAPEMSREQIILASRHQFEAGDVLHWWHPPSGRGVRTTITDDLLWLPYVTAEYIFTTGDLSVLDETAPFLVAEPLQHEEEDRYGEYPHGPELYSVYEHCLRAIRRGSTEGPHGLPRIGSGDWNDGMNRVGIEGRGESIWLGWFLYTVLERFAIICRLRQDSSQAEAFQRQAETLRQTLHEHGWDGQWYLRAYYDNGQPMGSAESLECKIDSIAQSWSVLSGAGDPERAQTAMESVRNHLVKPEDRLILLFTPPFNNTPNDPGYIKAYPPGVRENGGQYTHAATWVVWAFSQLGDGNTASQLFDLLNPVLRTATPEGVARYRTEPYVIAADVYGQPPYTGHGGWTWYTGSAGWVYRLGVEAILGLRRVANHLVIDPCIPNHWPEYHLTYRFGDSVYKIRVENPEHVSTGVSQVLLDGRALADGLIPLSSDGNTYEVVVHMAKDAPRPQVSPEQILDQQS